MKKRKFICVQSAHYPTERLKFTEQSQYIAEQTKSTLYDRMKCAIIETITSI